MKAKTEATGRHVDAQKKRDAKLLARIKRLETRVSGVNEVVGDLTKIVRDLVRSMIRAQKQ